MPHEIKHGHGIVENVPTAQEVERDELPPALLTFCREMREEIDALWNYVNNHERAEKPWDAEATLNAIETRKVTLRKIVKGD